MILDGNFIQKEGSMTKQVWRNGRITLASMLCGLVSLSLLTMWGCNSSGYNGGATTQVATKTATALIEAATLKKWINLGLVNSDTGEKVVILDITDQTHYDKGHIPGAVLVDHTKITQTRLEGVTEMAQMVLDGPHMDTIINNAGIDGNSTIVFTSGTGFWGVFFATRLYTTFRYWGFPKSRLKVLNGINTTWALDGYAMSKSTPFIQPSTYSVTPYGGNRLQPQLRASLGEMMSEVRNFNPAKDVIIDTLSDPTKPVPTALPMPAGSPYIYRGYPGSTSGLLPYAIPATKEYVVFEGHMKHAVNLRFSTMYDKTTDKFISTDALKSKFKTIGMDGTKTAYVHCRAGNVASVEFFTLDGILNWNVVWYDGSWGQWGMMADKEGGSLQTGSIWSTYGLSVSPPPPNATIGGAPLYTWDATDKVTYNKENGYLIQPLGTYYYQNLEAAFTSVTDPNANQIEKEDAAYKSPTASAPAAGGNDSGGGGC